MRDTRDITTSYIHASMASSPRPRQKSPPVTCPTYSIVVAGRDTTIRGSTPRDPRMGPRISLDASERAARADTRPTTTAANTDDVDGTARRTRLIEGAKHWRVRRIRDDARRTPGAARRDATRRETEPRRPPRAAASRTSMRRTYDVRPDLFADPLALRVSLCQGNSKMRCRFDR